MKVKTGFEIGDKVTYRTVRNEKVRAVVVDIINKDRNYLSTQSEYYVLRVVGKSRTYRKGDQIDATGTFMSLRKS